MSFKKNQKNYNKEVMQTGREANKYLSNSLGLINQYTTDYAGRNDFWLNKLNDRQLNLISDNYLAQNANMLRGQAAFGSNSETNRQLESNAYSQQNYLANVANQNVMNANQLQQNELSSLMNASNAYQTPINAGAQAAANVDAANNAWAGALGQTMSSAGKVVSMFPGWGTAIGGAMQLGGNALSSISSGASGLDTGYQDKQGNLAAQMYYGTGNATTGAQYGLGNIGQNLSNTLNEVKSNLSVGGSRNRVGDFGQQVNRNIM